MPKCQSSMPSDVGKPQIKYKGIHEPKGRVKGYRVEIRPPNSVQKIWVGTFDTRRKAMLAFDAAVYLTGKEPYYFVYSENYFPTRPNKPPREFVQTEAKKFAERTDVLPVNPTSFLVDTSKAGSLEALAGLTPRAGSERVTLITPDVKAVEKICTPALPDCSEPFARLDESLQNAGYLTVSAEQIPALEVNSFWDSLMGEVKSDVGEAKAAVEGAMAGVKEPELAAFDRGFKDPDIDAIGVLLSCNPPETFLPYIEGESFLPVFSPSRPSSKRKRDATEDANIVTDDWSSVGWSESGATDVDDWWQNLFFNDPIKQPVVGWGPMNQKNNSGPF